MDEDLMRDADVWLDGELQKQQTKTSALRKAKRALNRGLGAVWHIQISSPWKNLGPHHDDEQDIAQNYHSASLRTAIREAATDFCVLNRRVYPGHVSTGLGSKLWKHWDVQATWYISLVLAPGVHMSIPKEMYQKHIDELKEDTEEIFGPERKKADKRKLPTIP